jgi:hypothetical protein
MNKFDLDHWLQHDREAHTRLFHQQTGNQFVYQVITSVKPTAATAAVTNGDTSTVNPASPSNSTTQAANQPTTNQVTKTFASLTDFYRYFQSASTSPTTGNDEATSLSVAGGHKLINCLICGAEVKYTYIDALKHFQSEHEFNIFDSSDLGLADLELIYTIQLNNQLQLSQSVCMKRHALIKIPPLLVNPSASLPNANATATVTKLDLIDKEIKLLSEIYREQIVDKQIASWLNTEQFFRRNFNYNSYVCVICNSSKLAILDEHFSLTKKPLPQSALAPSASSASDRLQYYSDEMKTVVLTNHVLSHFNEYCYRCMSCKISWPDRTQLLKHAQECSNSQVVRTKTKYKLKANCRLQLKFYLHTYLDYWQGEKFYLNRNLAELAPAKQIGAEAVATNGQSQLQLKVCLKDIFLSKKLLLDASSRFKLEKIYLDEGKAIKLDDDEPAELETAKSQATVDDETKVAADSAVAASTSATVLVAQTTPANDIQMREDYV